MNILAWLRNRLGYADQKELAEKLEEPVLEESGVVKFSPEERKKAEELLESLKVRFEPDRLGDHLPIFGSAEEIIRIHRDHPEYLDARRIDDKGCTGPACDGSGKAGEPGQEEEDK